jgi:hypothetical protein
MEMDAQKFKVSWVPLIHYITTSRSSFNWDDILSSTLTQAISATKHMAPRKYPIFHMSSYLLDIMCLVHAYLEMGWDWKPRNPLSMFTAKFSGNINIHFEYQ